MNRNNFNFEETTFLLYVRTYCIGVLFSIWTIQSSKTISVFMITFFPYQYTSKATLYTFKSIEYAQSASRAPVRNPTTPQHEDCREILRKKSNSIVLHFCYHLFLFPSSKIVIHRTRRRLVWLYKKYNFENSKYIL